MLYDILVSMQVYAARCAVLSLKPQAAGLPKHNNNRSRTLNCMGSSVYPTTADRFCHVVTLGSLWRMARTVARGLLSLSPVKGVANLGMLFVNEVGLLSLHILSSIQGTAIR